MTGCVCGFSDPVYQPPEAHFADCTFAPPVCVDTPQPACAHDAERCPDLTALCLVDCLGVRVDADTPTGQGDIRQTAATEDDSPATLLDVVRVLSETYTDTGVLIWLRSRNKHLTDASGETFTPRQFIEGGRVAEVYEVACRIEGGSRG